MVKTHSAGKCCVKQKELDELEMNETLVPKGYNIGIGGASCKLARAGKRKKEEDGDLPKYMMRTGKGYIVRHVPKGKHAMFTSSAQTMEEKLKAAKAWLDTVSWSTPTTP